MPPNSQIVVDTSPIEAESSAPRQPTIDASIYCITIDDNCASTAGKLSKNVSLNCCPKVNSCPVLIKAKRASLFDFIRGNDFPKSSVQQFVCKIRNNYVAMQIVNPPNPFIPSKKTTILHTSTTHEKLNFQPPPRQNAYNTNPCHHSGNVPKATYNAFAWHDNPRGTFHQGSTVYRRYTFLHNPRLRSDSDGRGYQPPNKLRAIGTRITSK